MRTREISLSILAFLLFVGCSQMTISDRSRAEAQMAVDDGMQAFEAGDWKEAAVQFGKALKIDPHSAEAYAALGLVLAQNGQTDKARTFVQKALDENSALPFVHTARGRIEMAADEPQRLQKAIQSFDQALMLDPEYEAALFYKAEALIRQQALDDAAAILSRLIKLQGTFMERAAQKLQWVQKMKIARPKTDIGRQIINKPAISRADLAALLIDEFPLEDILNRRNPNLFSSAQSDVQAKKEQPQISDCDEHWAKKVIFRVVQSGVMDVFPDNTFRPNEAVRRMDFALTVQRIFILATGNRSLDTAFIGVPSMFPDVKQTHYAYNAIFLVTERGIMSADSRTGEFAMNRKVSGLDALISLRKLRAILNEDS